MNKQNKIEQTTTNKLETQWNEPQKLNHNANLNFGMNNQKVLGLIWNGSLSQWFVVLTLKIVSEFN